MRGERYWSGVLDPDESGIVEGRLTQHGIRCHHGVELARVVGRDGRVEAVETRDGSTFPCEILAVAIGVQPRLELAHGLGLATGRGIWTDERLQTADPDIFAAGDVAEVMDPESGRRGIDSLWSVAIEQGRAAGENMAGLDRPYRRTAPVNVTMIGGVTTTIIGALGGGRRDGDLVTIARGDSLAWREHPDGFAVVSASGGDHVRLVLGEDRIVGALVMGDQALSRQLQVLVRERADIRAVRDRLAAPGAAIRPVLAELLDGTASGGPR
jgi:NADPH-dependent 2,4-dienoyl-CoA reductase/sulfur reductase-like enzyme